MKESNIDFDVTFGLNKLWRWKWFIVAACVAAIIISVIITKQMKDEFKSTAAFVPPSFSSLGTMVFGNGIAYKGFYSADEEDIDRTVAYLESDEVMDSMAIQFNLYPHYGIDTSSSDAYRLFYNVYHSMVNIRFSSNSIVEIECWDWDRNFAKDMAEGLLSLASNYFERVSKRHEGLIATERLIKDVEAERKMILDSLSSLRSKYKIYHYDYAADALAKVMARQMETEPMFHIYYDDVKSMEAYIYTLELRYGDLQRELLTRKLNMEQFPQLIWITEHPKPSRFKDRPKRSIIVILSALSALVFSCFLAIVLDREKNVKA